MQYKRCRLETFFICFSWSRPPRGRGRSDLIVQASAAWKKTKCLHHPDKKQNDWSKRHQLLNSEKHRFLTHPDGCGCYQIACGRIHSESALNSSTETFPTIPRGKILNSFTIYFFKWTWAIWMYITIIWTRYSISAFHFFTFTWIDICFRKFCIPPIMSVHFVLCLWHHRTMLRDPCHVSCENSQFSPNEKGWFSWASRKPGKLSETNLGRKNTIKTYLESELESRHFVAHSCVAIVKFCV